MVRLILLALTAVSLGTNAIAHDGVKNPAVMARMHAMKDIGAQMKVLGDMAKGVTVFDAAQANRAAQDIAKHAAKTPDLFRAREDDPKSDARDVIWVRFDDFSRKADDLETLATSLAGTFTSKADLGPVLQRLGANCKDCHQTYRD